MKIKNIAISAVAFLGLLIVADSVVNHYIESDPDLVMIQEHVKSDPQISARFGVINEIHVKKLTQIDSSTVSPAYKLYALYVVGEKEAGLIEIKALLDPSLSNIELIQVGR